MAAEGVAQAQQAGKLLKEHGIGFDMTFTSVLKRAIRTHYLMLDEMDALHLPVARSWRLNERHYGALTGLNKAETAAKHGDEQVKIWRRSFDIPPPAVELDSEHFPGNDARYAGIDPAVLPRGESLALTIERVLPYWHDVIRPTILTGQRVLIADGRCYAFDEGNLINGYSLVKRRYFLLLVLRCRAKLCPSN